MDEISEWKTRTTQAKEVLRGNTYKLRYQFVNCSLSHYIFNTSDFNLESRLQNVRQPNSTQPQNEYAALLNSTCTKSPYPGKSLLLLLLVVHSSYQFQCSVLPIVHPNPYPFHSILAGTTLSIPLPAIAIEGSTSQEWLGGGWSGQDKCMSRRSSRLHFSGRRAEWALVMMRG